MSLNWKNESGKKFEMHAENILAPIYQYFIKDIEQLWQRDVRGSVVLEIGCGPGLMIEQFCLAGARHVIALDISAGMLSRAVQRNKRFPQVSYLVADASKIPLKKKSIDIVFSRGSIFFWKDIKRSFQEINNALTPEGIMLVGGGYGMNTPQNIVDNILLNTDMASKKSIPRLNLEELIQTALCYSSDCEIISKPKRGFWLKAIKTKNNCAHNP